MSATDGMMELTTPDGCPFGMSNFDHGIDDGFEEALRAEPGKVFGRHSAWDFNGHVWFDGESFCSEIWVYRAIVGVRSAATLKALMDVCNAEFGER